MSIFNYFCSECGAPARKKPVERPARQGDEAKATLGTWNCTAQCKRGKVKVRREKAGAPRD